MKNRYLAIDIGTSRIKAAIIDDGLNIISINTVDTELIIPKADFAEMDFEDILKRLIKCISIFKDELKDIQGIGLSVLCPGLAALDKMGNPMRNAIIHLDRRSRKQSLSALNTVGEQKFLSLTGNLPYPGGISLSSILWIKENENSVYKKTYKFGHTNTYLIKKFTGNFGMDPTNASFTGLYKTVDLSGWAKEIIDDLKITRGLLPDIQKSHYIAGYINKEIAELTGIKSGVPIVMGAADTACAVLGAGLVKNGDILNTTGTVEAITLTLDRPHIDKKLLLRAHPVEGKWLSMYIIGAGGSAIEWGRKIFFQEMEKTYFYEKYLVELLSGAGLKTNVKFQPYLCGDRLSMSRKRGSFSKLSLNSTRNDMILAIIAGVITPINRAHKNFKNITKISSTIYYTGQGNSFLYEIKKKMFAGYLLEEINPNSALIGAAKLLRTGLENNSTS
jgi:xylulokinase